MEALEGHLLATDDRGVAEPESALRGDNESPSASVVQGQPRVEGVLLSWCKADRSFRN